MRDEDKTKEELIQELVELRKQLAQAKGQVARAVDVRVEEKPSPLGAGPDATPSDEGEDPWLPIETKLVAVSVGTGIVILIGLATLVNLLLLGGH